VVKKIIFILLSFLIISCNTEKEITKGMYFWKVNQKIDARDADFLIKNNIQNYYVRFFDIGWNSTSGAMPLGALHQNKRINNNEKEIGKFKVLVDSLIYQKNIKIVPVIFIKNEVMKNIKKEDINELIKNIQFKINEIWEIEFSNFKCNEIQIDCDWSKTTKDNYFYFLDTFKKEMTIEKLTATIRLHQVKYPKITGVPPVDKGILMYYNMGKIKETTEYNSILNNETGQKYISERSRYPLTLDLALPIYSWSVWFREGEYKGLLYSINDANITDYNFLEKNENHPAHYVCVTDTVVGDNYFRNGDIFRLEKQSVAEINTAKKTCSPLFKNKNLEIILFDYSPENTQLITDEKLDIIYNWN
jgi:hypothetical protein